MHYGNILHCALMNMNTTEDFLCFADKATELKLILSLMCMSFGIVLQMCLSYEIKVKIECMNGKEN
jgi:hypothetical protein